MRTNRAMIAIPTALLSVSLLAGCGDKASKTASDATSSAGNAASSATSGASNGASSATDGASSGASSATNSSDTSNSSTSCPTTNSKSFAKTRFVTDLGLTAGTFHRYIYKPYQAGEFAKGQVMHHKMDAVQAGAAAALDVKLLKNATENAKANPTLCNHVAQPLSDAMGKLKGINTSSLMSGNIGAIAGAESAIQSALSGSKSTTGNIAENSNLSQAKSLVGG